MDFQREIDKLIKNSNITRIIWNNARLKRHSCLCGCGRSFKARGKYHQFYSRQCYSRFHRIPGFVRHILNGKD